MLKFNQFTAGNKNTNTSGKVEPLPCNISFLCIMMQICMQHCQMDTFRVHFNFIFDWFLYSLKLKSWFCSFLRCNDNIG